jgi:cysteine-rich repeat protein
MSRGLDSVSWPAETHRLNNAFLPPSIAHLTRRQLPRKENMQARYYFLNITFLMSTTCSLWEPEICPSGRQCPPGAICAAEEDACITTACGNGVVDEHEKEECDDGNTRLGDGCNKKCQHERCGNGTKEPGEVCDDGNTENLDGCSALCHSELCGNNITDMQVDEECDDGNLEGGDGCGPLCLKERCGNGFLDLAIGEECEDGNDLDGDGCSRDCHSETCGNGVTERLAEEECDDGNHDDGDGCSSTCQHEFCGNGIVDDMEECDNGSSSDTAHCNAADCTVARCGDRKVNDAAGEECDDGPSGSATCNLNCTFPICGDGLANLLARNDATSDPDDIEACDSSGMDTAGCNFDCTLPFCGDGYHNPRAFNTGTFDVMGDLEQCDDGKNSSTCNANCTFPVCGDGFFNPAAGEQCDGGAVDTFTCDRDCTTATCGDRYVNSPAGEACDDGNAINTDACPDGFNGTCQPAICGDGFRRVGFEECDGGGADTFACDLDCTTVTCGDGYINSVAGESCDDGNSNITDACPDGPGGTCQLAGCGDGFLRSDVEECDDGNSIITDACPSGPNGTCQDARCGDGFIRNGVETCDDGNGSNTDNCPDDVGGTCQPARCGDRLVDQEGPVTETCDDGGNSVICDGDCTLVSCGDGYVNTVAGEQCDDGNSNANDGCVDGLGTACQFARCGDSFVHNGVEQCDDGGDSNDCDADCSAAECGDGYRNPAAGEQCDDGNTSNGDNCSSTCRNEVPPPPPPPPSPDAGPTPPSPDAGPTPPSPDAGPTPPPPDAAQPSPDAGPPPQLGCYIGTPPLWFGGCTRFGGDGTSVAVFEVVNIGDGDDYTVTWVDQPDCSPNEPCRLPIVVLQRIDVSARVVNNNTGAEVILDTYAEWTREPEPVHLNLPNRRGR